MTVEGALAHGHDPRRFGGDGPGKIGDGGVKLGQRHGAVDEPEAGRRFGVDGPAGYQHLHRLLAADVTAERDHRRRAEEPDVHARRREGGAVRRHREITAGDKLAAGGGGDAVNARDHRLRQTHQRQHHLRALTEDCRDCLAIRGRTQILEIVAGAENRTDCGEHHRAYRAVASDIGEHRLECRHKLARKRVSPLRTIERESRDAVRVIAQKDGRLEGFGFGRRHDSPALMIALGSGRCQR